MDAYTENSVPVFPDKKKSSVKHSHYLIQYHCWQ